MTIHKQHTAATTQKKTVELVYGLENYQPDMGNLGLEMNYSKNNPLLVNNDVYTYHYNNQDYPTHVYINGELKYIYSYKKK